MADKFIINIILVAIIVVSCRTGEPENYATEPLDTIQVAPTSISANPQVLESAFIKGTSHLVNNKSVQLYGITIGNLKVPSGKIIACDPMHIAEYGKPFTQLFPIGEFPVQLSIARLEEAEIIVFARIIFSDKPVARWEFALLEGQTQLPLGKEKMHGYSVDAGVGTFIDRDAMKALDLKQVENADGELYTLLDTHNRNGWKYTMYNFGKYNLAAFTSGFGDGYFATYVGLDATGKPCRLVTDFNFIDWKTK